MTSATSAMQARDGSGAWVFYGGVPWDSPWLNDQHLAHAMAAHGAVLYVEPPRSPLAGVGRRSRARGQHVTRPRLRRADGGVHVLTTVTLPKGRWRLSQRLSAPLVRAQVRWAARRLGAPSVAASVAMGPYARRLSGAAGERAFVAFVSDWLEAGEQLFNQSRAALARASRSLWEAADVICVTSRPLEEALRGRGFASHLIAHAFDDTVASHFDDGGPPPEYAEASRPLMALAGRLNSRLDVDVLAALASDLPEASLYLIGPLSARDLSPPLQRLLERSNVHHIDAKSREELPAYLRHADVLLIPYVADEWSRYSSPMKIWDYLYAGRPIVGHGCPPLIDLGEPLAYHGGDDREVVDAVRRALTVDDPAGAAHRRRALAAANTWRTRADELRAVVAEHRG